MGKNTTAGQSYSNENQSQSRARERYDDHPQEDIKDRLTEHLKSRLSERVVLSGVKLRETATVLRNTGKCFIDEDQEGRKSGEGDLYLLAEPAFEPVMSIRRQRVPSPRCRRTGSGSKKKRKKYIPDRETSRGYTVNRLKKSGFFSRST